MLVFARTGVLTSLTIAANGADGTNADLSGSAHGPGGGGAGGVIYLSSAAGSTSVVGRCGRQHTRVGIEFGATPAQSARPAPLTENQIPGVSPGATCKATLVSVSQVRCDGRRR